MRHALTVLACLLAVAGCGGGDSGAEPRPGSPDVYERIAGLEDCAALQEEFDTASANHDRAEAGSEQAEAATAYMQAADERMREVGCY